MTTTTSIPFPTIRVLSFDIYGTLIDWESGIYTSLHSTPLSPHLPRSRKPLLEAFETHERAVQRENPTQRQDKGTAEVVRRLARDLRLVEDGKLDAREVEDAAVAVGAGIGAWPAFPDTVDAIRRLGARFALVPLSNVDRESFAATVAGPLKGCRFDAVYTAEDIGSYKPDPRNFEYLFEHVKEDFGADKEQICHVAQSLHHDHAPAKRFGLTSVWVDRKGVMGARGDGQIKEEHGYRLRVETLAELADIVDKTTA